MVPVIISLKGVFSVSSFWRVGVHLFPQHISKPATFFKVDFDLVVTGMDTPKYGETLQFVYIKFQPILVKSYQRFTKFNYGVTGTIYER